MRDKHTQGKRLAIAKEASFDESFVVEIDDLLVVFNGDHTGQIGLCRSGLGAREPLLSVNLGLEYHHHLLLLTELHRDSPTADSTLIPVLCILRGPNN